MQQYFMAKRAEAEKKIAAKKAAEAEQAAKESGSATPPPLGDSPAGDMPVDAEGADNDSQSGTKRDHGFTKEEIDEVLGSDKPKEAWETVQKKQRTRG